MRKAAGYILAAVIAVTLVTSLEGFARAHADGAPAPIVFEPSPATPGSADAWTCPTNTVAVMPFDNNYGQNAFVQTDNNKSANTFEGTDSNGKKAYFLYVGMPPEKPICIRKN